MAAAANGSGAAAVGVGMGMGGGVMAGAGVARSEAPAVPQPRPKPELHRVCDTKSNPNSEAAGARREATEQRCEPSSARIASRAAGD